MPNDILPPPLRGPRTQTNKDKTMHLPPPDRPANSLVTPAKSGLSNKPPKPKKTGLIVAICALVLFLIVGGVALLAFTTYDRDLRPVNEKSTEHIRFKVEAGASPKQIASDLQEKGLIRSAQSFDIYTRTSGTQNKLQAGTYNLSPAMPMSEIVEHIVSGKTDTLEITFYPGATLTDSSRGNPKTQKTDVTSMLKNAGYKDDEIKAALAKKYTHAVFADKPEGTDLEGYVFGETYQFNDNVSVEQVLTKTFDELYSIIEENQLQEKFKAQGLNLYQGITLASIVQKEVSANESDQKQVAQVFLKRLREGTVLGSDVSFVYGAHKLGVEPTHTLDSPYNTRIVKGLPPGPIASPGLRALQAVANPAAGDYEYFVAGDDGKTYFARTAEEHEENIKKYCIELCKLF